MHAHPKKEAVQPRWRAILRLAFGQTHVIGATAALVLLLQGGVSPRVKLKVALHGAWAKPSLMQPFERQMASLKETVLTMASHAESSVYRVIEALGRRDYDLAQRIEADDTIIDRFEVDVDDLAIKLLPNAARAGDLRFITVAMKVSQNLERVGDETTTIARRVQELCQDAPLKLALDIPQMSTLATQMLERALDAFVKQDPAAARALIPEDRQVDLLNKQNHQQLANQMTKDPESVTRCLSLMSISKSLERIADHAKNVAEEVVYLCEARDIRHTGPQEPAPGARAGVTKP
jgi:phosphate transport system protein